MSQVSFNRDMLQLARDLRGMTQTALAQQCKVRQPYISRIESENQPPSESVLLSMSEVLRVPVGFFFLQDAYPGIGISLVYYRKKVSALESHLRRIQAEVALRRILIGVLLRGMNVVPTSRTFCAMDIDEFDGKAEVIANLVRASWNIPLGPIQNLVGVIESAGGIVFQFSFGTKEIDALSVWPDSLPPLFFINAQAPADRIRFSLAHEVGHMVMHSRAAPSREMESEADRFASELLMPAKEIKPQLASMTLERAAILKPYWRVAMAALIRRAHDLKQLEHDEYRCLFREMSSLGLRKCEPMAIAPEEPRAVRKLIDVYQTKSGLGISELARLGRVYESDFAERFLWRSPSELRLTN